MDPKILIGVPLGLRRYHLGLTTRRYPKPTQDASLQNEMLISSISAVMQCGGNSHCMAGISITGSWPELPHLLSALLRIEKMHLKFKTC